MGKVRLQLRFIRLCSAKQLIPYIGIKWGRIHLRFGGIHLGAFSLSHLARYHNISCILKLIGAGREGQQLVGRLNVHSGIDNAAYQNIVNKCLFFFCALCVDKLVVRKNLSVLL